MEASWGQICRNTRKHVFSGNRLFWGPVGPFRGYVGAFSGAKKRTKTQYFGYFWVKMRSWGRVGTVLGPLGSSSGPPGPFWGLSGPVLPFLGLSFGLLGVSWVIGRLGLSWGFFGPSWAVLGPFRTFSAWDLRRFL